jgi:hypothetical protein
MRLSHAAWTLINGTRLLQSGKSVLGRACSVKDAKQCKVRLAAAVFRAKPSNL